MSEFDAKSIPTDEVVAAAAALEVFDVQGNTVKFGTLFEEQKTVVVFIRHFFCGICQAYVQNLARVPKTALDTAGTRIVVIGCGEYSPIKGYHETTGYEGPIYADPSRKLYRALGMTLENLAKKPSNEPRPGYLAHVSTFANLFGSIWRGPLRNPHLIGKQGNFSQLGGDFVFGPGNHCTFASRMRDTEDHISVEELMKAAGVEYTESK